MSCRCQGCGDKYSVDLIVPDELWEKIKLSSKPEGAGLLCGSCIMSRIEELGDFGVVHVSFNPNQKERTCSDEKDAKRKKDKVVRESEMAAEQKCCWPSSGLGTYA